KLHIIIHTIGVSKYEDWNWAGLGYTTLLVYRKNNLLYLQGFKNNKCYIQTYTDKGLLNTVYGKDPNDVWKNFNVLKNYNELQLYRLEESLTNKLLQHI
ncbi:470_t:CDS:1, partial [Cetraspora pellucida]